MDFIQSENVGNAVNSSRFVEPSLHRTKPYIFIGIFVLFYQYAALYLKYIFAYEKRASIMDGLKSSYLLLTFYQWDPSAATPMEKCVDCKFDYVEK